MPGTSLGNDPTAFVLPDNIPLGIDAPLDNTQAMPQSDWARFWWAQEATRFLDDVFANDPRRARAAHQPRDGHQRPPGAVLPLDGVEHLLRQRGEFRLHPARVAV
jgi:hypothetical protein